MKLLGKQVVVSTLLGATPNFVLAENVPVTQEFRREFNAWALEFFGASDQAFVSGEFLFVSPRTAENLLAMTLDLKGGIHV
jgi:hypothetical protein